MWSVIMSHGDVTQFKSSNYTQCTSEVKVLTGPKPKPHPA